MLFKILESQRLSSLTNRTSNASHTNQLQDFRRHSEVFLF